MQVLPALTKWYSKTIIEVWCWGEMKAYHLCVEQKIPISIDEAWQFFSSPVNLAKITPVGMKFEITSRYSPDQKMYSGMIISYKISPFAGYTTNWMTEITHIKHHQYFVDDQRIGPYALWHHEHHFNEIVGGILMTDILNYAIPFGVFGQIANAVFVGKEVKRIFEYRSSKIIDLFGEFTPKEF